MQGYGQAHGKVILMGEHSVVYGYPAIALPFDQVKIQSQISYQLGDIWLESEFYTGPLKAAPKDQDHLIYTIHSTIDHLHQAKGDLKITITSDLPASRGLGSSAAVAVATIRALFDYFGRDISDHDLISLAHGGEKIAHGNPSGIDVLTTAFDKAIYFRKLVDKDGATEKRAISISLPAYLIVADTKIQGQTKEAVERISRNLQIDPGQTQAWLKDLGTYALLSQQAIREKDIHRLGDLMTKAHQRLRLLEVSHPLLDHLVEKAIAFGALGAKLTGGGLGGCMICLADDKGLAGRIGARLRLEGAKKTWIYPMSERLNKYPEPGLILP